MNWEVEQKFPVVDGQRCRQLLDELGVQWQAAIEQVDHYFSHPTRDFAKTDEALRLRKSGGGLWTTYKGPKIDSATKTRREIEVPLHLDRFNEYVELFEALGFQAAGDRPQDSLAG